MARAERVKQFLLAFGLIVILTACVRNGVDADHQFGEKIMSETEISTGVSLTGKAESDGKKLVVEYTVKNSLPHSIYVFDIMIKYDEKGQPLLDKENAYRFWEEPSALRLVRAVLRTPPDRNVYALEIPYARELKTQSSVTGNIVLKLPVKEDSPFAPVPDADNSDTVKCDKVRLYIGWTMVQEGTSVTEVEVSGEKVLRVRGSWKPHLLREDLSTTATVVKFKDGFDRQLPQKWEE